MNLIEILIHQIEGDLYGEEFSPDRRGERIV